MVDANISSKIEMFVSCRRLANKDTFSKSDPMVTLFLKDGITYRTFQLIDRTEVIDNDLNPNFKKRFVMDYHFERRQELVFKVFDVDSTNLKKMADHDFLGMARTTIGDLISRGKAVLPLTDAQGRKLKRLNSVMIVNCREIGDTSHRCKITFKGDNLPKMDLFGRCDPYLEIYKQTADRKQWLHVKKTEVCKYTYNPRWKQFTITLADLCNNDKKTPLLVKCWDWDKGSSPDYVGHFETTVADLESKQPIAEFHLRKDKDKGKKRPKKRGKIGVQMILYKEHSFLDYIKGGCEVNLSIAIDFTASNGDPRNPRSLHYIGPGHANEYQKAIATIGNILTPYDTDNKYPVYGFGGRVKRTGQVEHCFPLTMNDYDPEVSGVGGVLQAYRSAFNHVLLSGPTYFSEVVATAAAKASATEFSSRGQVHKLFLFFSDFLIFFFWLRHHCKV
uniref:C2 domain-containing protein n=1 Tax=Lotharella globosa TaxID=91324 RepID=A0A7S4DNV9_9EUKA